MRTKNASIRELVADIRKSQEKESYNPAEDLKTLQTQYKRLGKREFGLLLDAMTEKYAAGEWSAIHAALVERARPGDVDAHGTSRGKPPSGGHSGRRHGAGRAR